MSRSSNETNATVVDYITETFDSDIKIIDLGAGAGKMWDLLHDKFPNMDAIEIWEPFIKEYLEPAGKYNKIININCVDFNDYDQYDLAIIGDMLEHLTVEDAQKLVKKLPKNAIIIVPYSLTLQVKHDNPYNYHHQNDLTIENMESRYPELKLIWENTTNSRTTPYGLGVYVK